MIINSYTTKANAIRGAARAMIAVDAYTIERNENGKFIVVRKPEPVAIVEPEPVAPVVVKPYKLIYSRRHSVVDGPFAVVHSFLDDHGASLTRKQAVNALVAKGVNYSTARTQYQRWFTKNKA